MSLLTPDAFRNDWYGWLTNQTGHIALGVFLSFWISLLYWLFMGELPVRTHVFWLIFSGYLAFELGVQGWRKFDSIEDTVFTVGYGASAVLWASFEIDPESATVSMSLPWLIPFFVVAGIHMLTGAWWRRRS